MKKSYILNSRRKFLLMLLVSISAAIVVTVFLKPKQSQDRVLSVTQAASQTPTPTASSGFIIVGGTVKDQNTGIGIPNVQVEVEDWTTSKLIWVTTNTEGSYLTSTVVKNSDIYFVRPQVYYGQQYCPAGLTCNQSSKSPNPWSYENQIAGSSTDCGQNCNFVWYPYVPPTPTNTPTPIPTSTPTPVQIPPSFPTPTLAVLPNYLPTATPTIIQNQAQNQNTSTQFQNQIYIPTPTNPVSASSLKLQNGAQIQNQQYDIPSPIPSITPINMNVRTEPNIQFDYVNSTPQDGFSITGFLEKINSEIKKFFAHLLSQVIKK